MHDRDSSFATPPLTAPLEAFGRADVAVAGGKGANLGELARAGLPVPAGFVVTTRAYGDAVRAAGLDQSIATALRGVDVSTPETVASASRAIQEAFLAAPMPDSVADAVREAYRGLGPEPVAVRSSATAEDLPTAAFAGQQDTFLNVIGEPAVLDAIRACWASLWSERAIVYRAHQGPGYEDVKLAVVVQRMVQADVAGVLFTANPVTGSRDEIVIDASAGLGEAVVAGLVTPEHLVLKKRTMAVIERRPGSRDVVVRAVPTGGTERTEVASDRSSEPYLTDALAGELARLAITVERHFGAPQDVEWARADRRFALLQARPITALPADSAANHTKRTGRRPPRFVAGLLGELFPIRPYPLDVTSYSRVLIEALREHMFGPIGIDYPPAEEAFVEQAGVVVQVDFGVRPTLSVLYRPWLTLWRNRRYDVAHWQDDPLIAEATRRAQELGARDLTKLTWDDLLATLDAGLAITPFVARLRHRYLPQAIRDVLVFWLLLAIAGQRHHFDQLQTGVETKTLEMNRALEALAAQVIASRELRSLFAKTPSRELLAVVEACPAAAPFLIAFQAFLDAFGSRESVATLASQPAWRNAPEIPLGVLQGMVAAEASARSVDPTDRLTERSSRWQQARDKVLANSVLGREPLRALFLRALREARRFPQLREDTHFYLTLGLPVVYATLQELGRRLRLAGALDEPRDVFHLTLAELKRAGRPWPPTDETVGSIRAVVVQRAAKRASLAGVPWVDESLLEPLPDREGAVVAGLPGSPGLAEGPVRVIHDSSQFGMLRPGDVLVAPFTSPAWTPLFQRAAAVVVDSGSPLSHAAVVAREYGIPAVLATVDATRQLRDGQPVRVDGTRGLVFRVTGA